jgi:peroxiredoxin
MMRINEPASDFELPDLTGNLHRLSDFRGKIIIINFWSCECPHSEHADQALTAKYGRSVDVVILPIASNRSESAQSVAGAAKTRGLPRVWLDANCGVADLYDAQTTPHVFVIDRNGILRYRGAVDNVTFRQRTATRFFLDEAVAALLNGQLPALTETPAYGCAIVREI